MHRRLQRNTDLLVGRKPVYVCVCVPSSQLRTKSSSTDVAAAVRREGGRERGKEGERVREGGREREIEGERGRRGERESERGEREGEGEREDERESGREGGKEKGGGEREGEREGGRIR